MGLFLNTAMHHSTTPSPWIERWSHLLSANSQVLDLACGHGRHMQFLQQLGHTVLGVDRDAAALQTASAYGPVLQADVENNAWPLTQQFDAVVVTNYLWRPLWPALLGSLRPGGVLLYETFAEGNETVGRPSRPEFLLRRGELLEVCAGLHVVAFEQGFAPNPDRYVQRIAAIASQENAPWPLATR